jgi:tripartite-type tricarboxylate transporter receptor subunit TctC
MKHVLWCVVALAAAIALPARAEYPDKPLRLVVPFTPAGPTDILARLLAEGFKAKLDAVVVIDNKPGAGGNLGTDVVAKSAPDGYTLLLGYMGPLAIAPSLYPKLPYKPLEDFAPVSLLATTPLVVVVNPSLPVNTMSELVRYAKSQPKGLAYASGGNGSANHMAAELFRLAAGVDLVHVPYKGIAPATMDVVAGQVPLMFDGLSVANPQIRAGKLRALAVTSRERAPSLPQVPTMQEAGYADYDVSAWFGLLAPAKLPAAIVSRLAKATREVMGAPEAKARLDPLGLTPSPGTPEGFAALMKRETAIWAKVVKASGVKAD